MARTSRRGLLAGAAATLAASAARGAGADGAEIFCAPTAASILVARLVAAGTLAPVIRDPSLHLWHDPDELRAAIVAGRTKLFTTPTHVPANLANRGLPIKLLAVLGMGHLVVVTSDPAVKSLADLAGKPVLGFFRNDMPDLIFRAAARMEGLDPDRDFKLDYVGMPMEAAQMLAAGRVETAILSEPAATGAIMMAARNGRTLVRAVNLQDVWIKHKGGDGIPMVGLAADARLIDGAPDLPALLRTGLPQAQDWVFANRAAAAELAQTFMPFRPAVFLAALDHAAIKVIPAKVARAALEDFYGTLLAQSPGVMGGRLPDAGFYLDL